MPRLSTLAALTAATLSLIAAPAALAMPSPVGNSAGTPTANICALSIECTYINYRHGHPTDVVGRNGTLVDWSVNAGSVGGQVQLRVLRPVGHGQFKLRSSSSPQTVTSAGENTFSSHIAVRKGDVLALTNTTSGIYMASAPAGTCVRYFDTPIQSGVAGKPDRAIAQLHLLLSADVNH